ncbi:MAG TPA: GDSL-type esterase/lipase family protein, partial [Baekduia sp.]|nr:GDSL-type esterase/lipase family protein [Baekduia sp.]
DSYISGEAGRWQGNSLDYVDRDGTDRACVSRTWWGGCNFDYGRVYLEGTYDNGCHRSDVAEIRSAGVSVNEKINLACSGATTANIFRASQGGQARNGEAPQADRLLTVAQQKNVKLVVLSIGGNDLGFADIIIDCTSDWSTSSADNPDFCQPENQAAVTAKMPTAMANVRKAVDEVRAVMTQAGYSSSQYRFVLQSYPSPIPRGSENRYPETGWSRLDTGGCPFWNSDSTWARDSLVHQIANNLKSVAAAKGVQFLDLRDQLEDREVCSIHTSQVTGSSGPSSVTKEWVRWLNSGCCSGDAQESMHPNAYGQQAAGRCLTLIWAQPATTNWSCTNVRGTGTGGMTIKQI